MQFANAEAGQNDLQIFIGSTQQVQVQILHLVLMTQAIIKELLSLPHPLQVQIILLF